MTKRKLSSHTRNRTTDVQTGQLLYSQLGTNDSSAARGANSACCPKRTWNTFHAANLACCAADHSPPSNDVIEDEINMSNQRLHGIVLLTNQSINPSHKKSHILTALFSPETEVCKFLWYWSFNCNRIKEPNKLRKSTPTHTLSPSS